MKDYRGEGKAKVWLHVYTYVPCLGLFTYGQSKPLKARIFAPFIFMNVTKHYT